MPPAPARAKPKPSSIGVGNVTPIRSKNETLGFVCTNPRAVSPRPSIAICTAPRYSELAESKLRKPPPVTTPASMDRPSPVGCRKRKVRSAGPRLPRSKPKATAEPTSFTDTASGPSAMSPLSFSPRVSADGSTASATSSTVMCAGPIWALTGIVTTSAAPLLNTSPVLGRHSASTAAVTSSVCGSTEARNPSAPPRETIR
jgi:hypothetical protein